MPGVLFEGVAVAEDDGEAVVGSVGWRNFCGRSNFSISNMTSLRSLFMSLVIIA